MNNPSFLSLLLLLPVGAVSAQSHHVHRVAASRMVQNRPVLAAQKLEALQVGDTCYVTSQALHLRTSPDADYRPHMAFEHGKDLIVREVTNDKWILIESFSEDVSIMGYVSRKYVSKVKPK